MATTCVSDRYVNDVSRVSQIVFFFLFMDADLANGLLIYSFYCVFDRCCDHSDQKKFIMFVLTTKLLNDNYGK